MNAHERRTKRRRLVRTLKEAFAPLTDLMFRQMDERDAELDKFPLVRALRSVAMVSGARPGRLLDGPIEFDAEVVE